MNDFSVPRQLAELGWDSLRSEEWSAMASPGAQPGRVVRDDRTTFEIALADGALTCRLARALQHDPDDRPTTGDWAAVADGEIVALLERRTAVRRASSQHEYAAQVLCANVDSVLVVAPLGGRFRARKLERLLVLAWQSGAIPIVVLTKADCSADPAGAMDDAAGVAPGVSVHAVSALTAEGLDALAAELSPGRTAVALGPSGAGKSTLANSLGAGDVDLATAEIRSDGKGRHTTVRRELVRLANGALMIDTPGLRSIGLFDAEEAIGEAFSDIEVLAGSCRFSDCGHVSEPGCAVLEAIAEGDLDPERLDSYGRLLRDQERLAVRGDAKLTALRGQRMRAFYKQQRQDFRR